MSNRSSSRLLVAGVVWLLLIAVAAVSYRLIFVPKKNQELVNRTTPIAVGPGGKPLTERVALSLDSFSGYCVFRSAEMRDDLAAQGIAFETLDDAADYAQRFEALRKGNPPLAVFTLDALIKASAARQELPGTVVMIIDETVGADAMIAYQQAVPNLDALNKPEARLVLTPDSPSEMLARVALAKFHLPLLPADPWVPKNGAADVFNEFRQADPKAPRAYVLWEPYVTKALEDKRAHVVMDSGSFSGYIVDVLVAERQFLIDKPQVVQAVVETYQRVAYRQRNKAGGMLQLVTQDAQQLDPPNPLTNRQAERLVQGIHWKTTQENYAHFGILQGASAQGLRTIDEMIREITAVLLKTKAISADPTDGSPNRLYYDQVLRFMNQAHYHPDKTLAASATSGDGITAGKQLNPLDDEGWQQLKPLGRVEMESLLFARASDQLLDQSQETLDKVAQLMVGSFPQTYLLVQGHARPEGDAEQNRRLAEMRARSAADYLAAHGVAAHRLRAVAGETQLTGGEAQSVTFVLKQMPF